YRSVQDFRDLPPMILEQIAHFFEHYKDLDEGKWVRVDGWYGIDEAKEEILKSVQMYKDAPEKPKF
ncbi:MAG TPA: inorganic diphosphatase, partial [Gammaproteobacteria bacterium]